MAKRDQDSWIIALVIALIALGLGGIWMFSRFFGLDMATGFSVLLRLLLLAGVAFVCWKFGDDAPFLHPGRSWPLLLALLILCWWPALDFWAQHQSPRLWAGEEVELWWNAWYTELAVVLAGVAGYVLNLWREE